MNSPVAALAWEIWRKNRFGFLLLFVFLIVCLGFGRVATHFAAEASRLSLMLPAVAPEVIDANTRATDWLSFAGQWSGVLLGLSFLVTLAMFAFAESSRLRGFSGIPSRLFTLPVRTGQLVTVPMASGVCFVALLYLAWSRLVLAPILPPDVRMADSYFLLLLPAALAGFQTLVWTLPGFPRTRVTLLILLIASVAVLSVLPFSELNRWPERKLTLMAIYAALLVVTPCVAWLGVTHVREGQWRDWPALTALMNRLADTFARRRDFSGPAGAQFWIECRRNGRLALWGLAVVISFVLGLNTIAVVLNNGKLSESLGSVYGPILLFLDFIWTPVLGLMVCGDLVSRRLPLTSFQATRPVTVGELVSAKLKAMVAVWLGGWLLAVLSAGVWAVVSDQFDAWFKEFYIERGSGMGLAGIDLVIIGALSLQKLVGLFPLWLTGRVPGLPWSFVILLIVYVGLGDVIGWFVRHPNYRDAALLLIGCAAALKLGVAFLAFRLALKRKLVKRGFVFGSVSIWIVGTALCLWFAFWIAERSNGDEVLRLSLAALLFPLARIALAPLALAMNRHR
ncbi:MAG: hypothetical protein DME22_07810 [Verrucomicrobia bacterium]|nr:MAG: hypothetical protein DME22_07810 [Verrucomicrobiota bacterium]